MASSFKPQLQQLLRNSIFFVRGVLLAVLIGLICGVVSSAFYHAFIRATDLRVAHPWLLWLLPVGGVVIVLLYRLCGMERDKGTNLVLTTVREKESLPFRTAPLVFVSSVVTHLVGGSAGREGAILQIGGSLSASIGRLLRLDENGLRIITMCGMSAAFSALFGTPLAAAIFAMEVISVGVMYYAAIVPCVISAVTGLWVAQQLRVPGTAFALTEIPAAVPLTFVKVIGMGILFALLSILFCWVMHSAHKLYDRFLPNRLVRVIVGGCIVLALTYLIWLWNPGTYDYNGAGENIIHAAIEGHARPEAFLLKIIFTALTLGAGYKGGEIVPVFFTGAVFGCVAAPLLGLPASFGAALGMASVFCGVTNCPLTSILLALELFGTSANFGIPSLSLFAISIAVSYMLSGYYGLYSEQKIMYDKFHPLFINRKAH